MSELGMLAVENHMSGDRRMTIRVPNGAASPAWIAQTIGVAASPPDLQKQAFAFIGARPCKLGPVKAAYLFYEHEGKIASVFVVRTQDLGFSPAADRPYGAKIRGCDVKAWRRGDALYVLVI
jgi:anti-sigma factor RsiW